MERGVWRGGKWRRNFYGLALCSLYRESRGCYKGKYNLHMYVNAGLNTSDSRPKKSQFLSGRYSSSVGALGRTMNVYQAIGTNIDVYSPDVYRKEFEEKCAAFWYNGNPLLIPEPEGLVCCRGNLLCLRSLQGHRVSLFGIDLVWKESELFKKHNGVLARSRI